MAIYIENVIVVSLVIEQCHVICEIAYRDCLTRWIWLLMTRMVSSRPKGAGTGPDIYFSFLTRQN
jgi:hypothetical protein